MFQSSPPSTTQTQQQQQQLDPAPLQEEHWGTVQVLRKGWRSGFFFLAVIIFFFVVVINALFVGSCKLEMSTSSIITFSFFFCFHNRSPGSFVFPSRWLFNLPPRRIESNPVLPLFSRCHHRLESSLLPPPSD
ncbi:hypothetical protein JDV02_006368 [Purpureocillium takamizusanense]|uniref:Uncharacterized protein n=1 Tax=Purpureocillium takamizusanense TaxID=2060973 RepID=A0A9Q8QK43_9HYPO|nr:uncharacterized protein JDV02_006368 [Purpureocillium takamizusanense]UNI20264.1 hypothetical protein JDV02_006368 [Purpureocillium takamizusanense]